MRDKITETGKDRTEMDVEAFGNLVASLRREKGLTQKQLAEKLFISNKAVSKWERGLSMPDISLLEPLAELLGVSVSELLRGKRETEEVSTGEPTAEELQRLGKLREEAEEKSYYRQVNTKKRVLLYLADWAATGGEVIVLYLFGNYFGITALDTSLDILTAVLLPLLFGLWFFFFMTERLPSYYDKEKISYFQDGMFHISVPGIYFNNRNWPHIMAAGRRFCFWMPVLWPAAYFLIRLILPDEVWFVLRIPVLLTAILGGLFVPIVVAGKKYQ